MNEGFGQYAFLVTVCSNDYDLINNFGYRREENFHEEIRRTIMKALAEHPHLTSIDIDVVDIAQLVEMQRVYNETMDEEVDDE